MARLNGKNIEIIDNFNEFNINIINPLNTLEKIEVSKPLDPKIKSISGLYFLLNDKNVIIYIGQSKNIRNRISTHLLGFGNGFFKLSPQVNPEEVKHVICLYDEDVENLDFMEQFYILMFQPYRNFWQYYNEFKEQERKELEVESNEWAKEILNSLDDDD